MGIKGYLIASVLVIVVYLVIVSHAVKWADNISKQTEQNFINAVKTMQGK